MKRYKVTTEGVTLGVIAASEKDAMVIVKVCPALCGDRPLTIKSVSETVYSDQVFDCRYEDGEWTQ